MMMQQEMHGTSPPGAMGGKGKIGAEKSSPSAQASHLKTEIKPTSNTNANA